MREFVLIKDLSDHEGAEVTLRGWLYGKRSGGKVVFLQLRDGTGICQCVVEAAVPEAFELACGLGQESSLSVSGKVRRDERASGGCELAVTGICVIQEADGYPITHKSHGIDFLMNHRHLWLRSRRPCAIMLIRHTLVKACRDFLDDRGFTLVDAPLLVPGAGEDSQTLFSVEYFDRKAFLSQTGQLYLESACMALGRVYCFGPTFRAEKSKTRRHLTEFWMIEPEVAFAELDDVMNLAEDMMCYIVEVVLSRHEEELTFLGRDLDRLRNVRKPFVRKTYTQIVDLLRSKETARWLGEELERDRATLRECVDRLKELEEDLAQAKKAWKKDKITVEIETLKEKICEIQADLRHRPAHIESAASFEWGKDLGGSDETIISRMFDKPIFVTDYPKQAKAFYMKESSQDARVVRNMDLLAPEGYGEIVGGSQREDSVDALVKRMEEKGLKPDDYGWYLDLRRYGSVPHGGFGMGIERTLNWICGLEHVRETIPFPRTLGRLYP